MKSETLKKLANIQEEIEVIKACLKENNSYYYKQTSIHGDLTSGDFGTKQDDFTATLNKIQSIQLFDLLLSMKEQEYKMTFEQLEDK